MDYSYSAVLEYVYDEKVRVTFSPFKDKSLLKKNQIFKVFFSEDRGLDDIIHDFTSKLPPSGRCGFDTCIHLEYDLQKLKEVYPFFIKYMVAIGNDSRGLRVYC